MTQRVLHQKAAKEAADRAVFDARFADNKRQLFLSNGHFQSNVKVMPATTSSQLLHADSSRQSMGGNLFSQHSQQPSGSSPFGMIGSAQPPLPNKMARNMPLDM